LAVDETGVYLLVGLFIAERQGFYVVRLDQYLQPVNDGFYYIYDPARDLGLSIALGDQRVYVGGITGFDSSRWEGTSVFILELNKTDLSPHQHNHSASDRGAFLRAGDSCGQEQ